MSFLRDYFKLGISPAMLYKNAFDNDAEHLYAFIKCCDMEEYEVIEAYLPHDASIRNMEIGYLKRSGKNLNYNCPKELQMEAPYNAGSDNAEFRRKAVEFTKLHINYAVDAGCKTMVLTSCLDQGDDKRSDVYSRFKEYFHEVASYAEASDINIVIEPAERGCFKNLLIGSTKECCEFIKKIREEGTKNVFGMIDTAHLTLMGETFEESFRLMNEIGIAHIHLGDAVTDSENEFYGHTHPPLGIQKGYMDLKALVQVFKTLVDNGYIDLYSKEKSGHVSLEVQAYPGVSAGTSARFMYEKIRTAFFAVLEIKAESRKG